MAASAAFGIISITGIRNSIEINRQRPWKKLAQRVRAPKPTLAELRATSDIIGDPPTTAASVLPAPTAIRSLLKLDCRLQGSRLSTALTVRQDSRLPTRRNMITYFQNAPVPICEKSALKAISFQNSPI